MPWCLPASLLGWLCAGKRRSPVVRFASFVETFSVSRYSLKVPSLPSLSHARSCSYRRPSSSSQQPFPHSSCTMTRLV